MQYGAATGGLLDKRFVLDVEFGMWYAGLATGKPRRANVHRKVWTMPSRLVTEPVYQQLNALLRQMLGKGEFRPGRRFLTEREIGERFRVSRATANKALSNLVSEGLLVFRKGVGTYVRDGLLDYDLARLVSFTDKARAAGLKPSTRVLAFAPVRGSSAPEEIRAQLGVGEGDGLYWMERLRLADGAPVILERRYVVACHCPGLSRKDVSGSLYDLWAKRFGLEIAGADQIIRAVNTGREEGRFLRVARGSPALLVECVGRLKGESPLWHERTLYRGDRYEFHHRLGPLPSASQAVGRIINTSSATRRRP